MYYLTPIIIVEGFGTKVKGKAYYITDSRWKKEVHFERVADIEISIFQGVEQAL